jgi:hypothetical protein
VEKISPKNICYFCDFQKAAQNKQSPIRRKFTQSGHPGHGEKPVSDGSHEKMLDIFFLERRLAVMLLR